MSPADTAAGAAAFAPELPPELAAAADFGSVDEAFKSLNRIPLFMTELDETGDDAGATENIALEAIRALAYEGTPLEVAANFKEQGDDLARAKRWADAREFYDKALVALTTRRPTATATAAATGETEADAAGEVLSPEEEERRMRSARELCHVNRALCNLELKNYRACTLDCAATLRLNASNVKAWYRGASACLALDRIAEADDACRRGIAAAGGSPATFTASTSAAASLTALSARISARARALATTQRARHDRHTARARARATLQTALRERGIRSRAATAATARPVAEEGPDLEDAVVRLVDPEDAASGLLLPVLLLYPMVGQSDFLKSVQEADALDAHLEYVLPPPWVATGGEGGSGPDGVLRGEGLSYAPGSVDVFAAAAAGGLARLDSAAPLLQVLAGGNVELVDGMVQVFVVPKTQTSKFTEEFEKRVS